MPITSVINESDNTINNNTYFEKKTKISYGLSILVFLIHCSSFANYKVDSLGLLFISNFFQSVITPVAVPLFFIISGATYYRDYDNYKYVEKTKRRIFTLCIPFVAWNTINMLFDIVATLWFSQYFIGRLPFEFNPQSFIVSLFHYEHNVPFWFIFALIIFSLFAPLFAIIIHNKWFGFVVIITLTILTLFGIGLPVPLFFEQTCIIYYLIGAMIGRYCFKWFSSEHSSKEIKIAIGTMILSCTYIILEIYNIIPYITSIRVVVLTLFCFGVWVGSEVFLKKISIREYMKHSFWVYALHINVSAVVTKLLFILLPK